MLRGFGSLLALVCGLLTMQSSPPAVADDCFLDLANFGRLNQRTIAPPGNPFLGQYACGPTAVANSFVYLEKTYPARFQRTLIPELGDPDHLIDAAEIENAALILANAAHMATKVGPGGVGQYDPNTQGWIHGDPGGSGAGGTTRERFALGKEFFRTGLPPANPIDLSGQYLGPWVPQPEGYKKPDWLGVGAILDGQGLAAAIADGEDVEVGFTWEQFIGGAWVPQAGGHFVTAYGFQFTDLAPLNGTWDAGEPVTGLHIIDPWGPLTVGDPPVPDPNLPLNAPALTGALSTENGNLFLQYDGGAAEFGAFGDRRGKIRMWVSEAPEPAALVLLLFGGPLAIRRVRPYSVSRSTVAAGIVAAELPLGRGGKTADQEVGRYRYTRP